MLHATIKKVSGDYTNLSFNTAISQLMICANKLSKEDNLPQKAMNALSSYLHH